MENKPKATEYTSLAGRKGGNGNPRTLTSGSRSDHRRAQERPRLCGTSEPVRTVIASIFPINQSRILIEIQKFEHWVSVMGPGSPPSLSVLGLCHGSWNTSKSFSHGSLLWVLDHLPVSRSRVSFMGPAIGFCHGSWITSKSFCPGSLSSVLDHLQVSLSWVSIMGPGSPPSLSVLGVCHGSWTTSKSLSPGKEVTLTLTPRVLSTSRAQELGGRIKEVIGVSSGSQLGG